MAKSINAVHNALQKKKQREAVEKYKQKLFAEVNRRAEDYLSDDVFTGQKALVLLALRKEGWGKQRALRLLKELDELEKAFQKDDLGNSISWEDVFSQVKEEYGIEFDMKEG